MARLQPVVGLVLIGVMAYALSTNRRAIKLRVILWGLGLQFLFALFVLKTGAGRQLFRKLGDGVTTLLGFADQGSSFVFGSIYTILAIKIAGTIIFVAALFAILYYIGVMQVVVRMFAWLMSRAMGASGAESLNVAASIFMGQTEAPLTIRPYLAKMTQSELMTVMTSGMAHISGGIMAVYSGTFHINADQLLTAVIMTAPGTLMMAKLFVPETAQPETSGTVRLELPKTDVNIIDAAGRGTAEGLHLALNVLAMLVSFIALIALLNALLGIVGGWFGHPEFSMQLVLGWIFAPVAWSLGIPWHDAGAIGNLLGTRMVLNEFIAFQALGPMKEALDPRTFAIATFALCGFANFASIGIQIGGIGALAPERRHDLARLGMRAMLAGTLANFASACIAGILF
ncbi:MAG TPA: nucleoside transporter C-terminal domain-containing protein [Vicinamibacterales bacterium]|nr:nucleoside transporter C-terminal domain-containing protein [Vicinamibacterales bacterium]